MIKRKAASLIKMATIVAGIIGSASLAQAAPVKTETFDTAASALANGWVGFNNDPTANTGGTGGTIAFSNTNNTLGNPAGEAGGAIGRTDGLRAYYADTYIGPPGGTLKVGNSTTFSGELYLQSGAGADTNFTVGYINKSLTNPTLNDEYIGFQITSGNNVRANVFGGDYGGYNGSGGDALLAKTAAFANGAYTFTANYVANGFAGPVNYGEITLTITPAGGGPSVVLHNALNPAQNRLSKTLDSFGISSFNASDGENFNKDTRFLDNLTYTVIPEPATLGLATLMAGVSLLRRRR